MERAKLLIIVSLGVLTFLFECPTGSVAVRICPLRAEPVYPAQENGILRCACVRPFFGKNCRYKQQNGTIALNGTRLTKESVLMKWKENAEPNEGRRYLISVRKVEFKLSTVKLHKWQKASIEYMEPNNTLFKSQQETESSDDLNAKEMYTEYTAVLRLPGTSSYEVKITTLSDAGTAGNHVGSTSAIFDASDAFVNGTMLGITDSFEGLKNLVVASFHDDCAIKGIVTGVVMGSLGTLMLVATAYTLHRYCSKCGNTCRRLGRNDKSDSQKQENPSNIASTEEDGSCKEFEQLSESTSSYVVIEMEDIELVEMEKELVVEEVDNLALSPEEPEDISQKATPEKSVILDIPETVIDGDEPAKPEPTAVASGQEVTNTTEA